jgi:hypothetical protein
MRLRSIALLTSVAFACATSRQVVPAGAYLAPRLPERIALAEPQLELWMEGTRAVDPAEESRKLAESREALAAALDGRGLDAPDPDGVLVVSARAIARTGERKDAQLWSAIGLVVVFVIVIVATIALSRSRSSSGGRSGGPGLRPAPGRLPTPGGVTYLAPRRYAPPPPVGVFLGFNVAIPVGAPPPLAGLPPTDAWLASRGWYDGDELELSLELQDPTTGAVQWRRVVKGGVDPADRNAVAGLVDHALADVPFGHRGQPENP